MGNEAASELVRGHLADPYEALYRLIAFASRDLRQAMRQELAQWGLTGAQFGVLLGAADEGSIGEIADGLFSDATSVGRVVKRMQAAGLVECYRRAPDRRVVWVRLQPAGEELLARVLPHHVARAEEMLGFLPAAQRDQLAGILAAIVDHVAELAPFAGSGE